ncbi:MAG TPA: hypothetical protein VGB17_09625 [Pyrinomonadaceae bacterium]|jgi:hypothetical protein
MKEIYVSTDIETDGPVPGLNSMLSFGSAVYLADKTLIATFSANLETLAGASSHPDTMSWWATQGEAWEACRKNPQPPSIVMPQYAAWLKSLPGTPVFVGYPAAFDFMFVTYYLYSFAGESPFSYFALDIKSYAMALMKVNFSAVNKSTMPKRWFDDLPYTHVALDDAISQGALFCNMLAENTGPNKK